MGNADDANHQRLGEKVSYLELSDLNPLGHLPWHKMCLIILDTILSWQATMVTQI